jgi:hypothetical protein
LKRGIKFIMGYCWNSCPGSTVKNKNSEDCININGCFESLIFNVPKIFSI